MAKVEQSLHFFYDTIDCYAANVNNPYIIIVGLVRVIHIFLFTLT